MVAGITGDHKVFSLHLRLQFKLVAVVPKHSTCIYIRENQQMHQLLFNLLVMYGGSYMFLHYIAILREHYYSLPRDVLNWGAVDKILWIGVLYLATSAWSVLRTATTTWASWLEGGGLRCINYFGKKISYNAGTCKIKRWKVTNLHIRKMQRSDISITCVLPFRFCTWRLWLSSMTWRQGTLK
jgi:hypothetical protein